MGETGGSELARPALIAAAPPSAAWRRRGIVLDRYFTRVAIETTGEYPAPALLLRWWTA